jgi:hypothetical protein
MSIDPCYCLQSRYANLPGPYDLFYCLTYPQADCDDNTAFEELWYGVHGLAGLPQHCELNQCEPMSAFLAAGIAINSPDVPGHSLRLVQHRTAPQTTVQADELILPLMREDGVTEPAGEVYFSFAKGDLHADRDVQVMAVPVKVKSGKPKLNGQTRYFSFELETIDKPNDRARNVRVVSKRKCQFTVDYEYGTGTTVHRAFVWLKDPITWEAP